MTSDSQFQAAILLPNGQHKLFFDYPTDTEAQELVGGWLELVHHDEFPDVAVIVNEEAAMIGLERNRWGKYLQELGLWEDAYNPPLGPVLLQTQSAGQFLSRELVQHIQNFK